MRSFLIIILLFLGMSQAHAQDGVCESSTMDYQITDQVKDLCQVVKHSKLCKEVDEKDLLRCEPADQKKQIQLWEYISGCSKGVLDSSKEILIFMWDILKWAWDNSTSSETLSGNLEEASDYINSVKLYLHTEYSKAYAKTSDPFREMKAANKMGGVLSEMILDMFTEMISEKYQQFGCLNPESQSKVMCKFIGTVFIPPAAAIGLIKYGPKVIKQFPNIEKAFATLAVKSQNNMLASLKAASGIYARSGHLIDRSLLSPVQLKNLKRFEKKVPKGNTRIIDLGDGRIAFTTEVPGQVPGSKAVYEKLISSDGTTLKYYKTTYTPDGKIVHIKDKINNGIVPIKDFE